MKLYHLVLKDILRRKKRVLYAALGVVVATMTVVGILTIAHAGQEKIYTQLEQYGANLSVLPAISNVDMALGDLNMGALTVGENYISEDIIPDIRRIADGMIRETLDIQTEGDLATIAPKLYVSTTIKGTSLMAVGINPDAEMFIKTWWRVGEGRQIAGSDEILAGATAARVIGLKTGDIVSLNGRDFTVAGVLEENGSADDFQVFAPLIGLQKAYGKEGFISSIDVRALCNGCPVDFIADGINNEIAGVRALAVKQVAESEMGMVDKMSKFMLALAGITLVIGSFGVVNTMMTSVHERIKDIGIMRAVGASRNQIIKIFIYEAVVIGVIGGILGYILGTLVAYGIGPLVFEGSSISYLPQYLPLSLILATVVAVIATSYPAFRATNVKVSDSFRSL